MVSDEALKKLQEQIEAWPMTQRFVVQQLIEDYRRNREDLRAYKATGLTPEEVLPKDKADEIALKLMRLADLESLCSYTRLRELAEAAADVAPVGHGRWEQDADGDWYCTSCDEVVAICESGRERTYRKPYCPNCGAKMDGGDSDEADRR